MAVLGAAHRLLADLGRGVRRPGSEDLKRPERVQAVALLSKLGYVVENRFGHGLTLESDKEAVHRNRLALLKLASGFKAGFELPLPHAPGARFYGAKLSPRDWGLEHHGSETVGVAGRGLTLRRAFESCVGEAAGFLSFLEWGDESLVSIGAAHDEDSRVRWRDSQETGDAGLADASRQWCLSGVAADGAVEPAALDWIEARDALDGQKALFPAELCVRRRPDRRGGRWPAASSGVGAGATWELAVLDGLLESIERDSIALWWFGGAPARAVDPAVERSHKLQAFMMTLRGEGRRRCWLLDLTSDLGIPVVAALSSNAGGEQVVAGFAASSDLSLAIRRAMLEMSQMELGQELSLIRYRKVGRGALLEQERKWLDRFVLLSTNNFPQLGPPALKPREHKAFSGGCSTGLLGHLRDQGFSGYVLDLTRRAIGIPVARVLVPGLQSLQPGWITPRLRRVAGTAASKLDERMMGVSPI